MTPNPRPASASDSPALPDLAPWIIEFQLAISDLSTERAALPRALEVLGKAAGARAIVLARERPEQAGDAEALILASWLEPGSDGHLLRRCLTHGEGPGGSNGTAGARTLPSGGTSPRGEDHVFARMGLESEGQGLRLTLARPPGRLWRTDEMFTLRQLAHLLATAVRREAAVAEMAADRTRLAGVLHNITDCWLHVDPAWRIVDLNESAGRFLRHPPHRLIGASLWQAAPGLLQTMAFELLRNAAADGLVLHFEEHLRDLDVWAEFHLYPKAGGLGIYFRDITARKHATADLTRLAGFTEHHPMPIVEIDLAGQVRYANQVATDLAATYAGGDATRLLPSDHRGLIATCLKRNLTTSGVPGESCGQRWLWTFRPSPGGATAFAYATPG